MTEPSLRLVGSEPPDRAPRPQVILGKDLHRVVSELDRAAGENDPLLFQRDNELVAIVGSRAKEGKAKLEAGTPIIRPLRVSSVLPRLTEYVRCVRWSKPEKGVPPELYETIPDKVTVGCFLEALDWVHVRRIKAITECPTLRPDGTVMQDRGFDSSTGYLYLPTSTYPRIADQPTQSDAVLAYAKLVEVFCDFPYVAESHRSAVIASILALVGRPAILGSVPCMLFDASSKRSGKTLQIDVISEIVTGRVASRMTYPETDEELEKVLSGYALVGARMINFDNVGRSFGGAPLDKCITAIDSVDLRVLGSNVMRTLSWSAVVFASGNNVRGRGDILERVLAPRLESPLEHPEKRDPKTFRHPNLREWVKEHRCELVACALTILRAYCAAGHPKQPIEPWGGFEAFAELVAAALVWTGAPDPMGARRGGDEDEDPTALAERGLVSGWELLCKAQSVEGLSLSSAIKALYPAPSKDEPPDGFDSLREAIAELTNAKGHFAPDTRKLGYALRKIKGRPYDGKRLVSVGAKDGQVRWGTKPAR